MSELYRETIMEHYHNPQNFGVLDPADVEIELDNPTCGDHVHVTLRLDDEGKVSAMAFEGHGCVVSMAAASMLTEAVVGKSPDELKTWGLTEIQDLMGGIRLSMGRVKCATLALEAVKRGLAKIGK